MADSNFANSNVEVEDKEKAVETEGPEGEECSSENKVEEDNEETEKHSLRGGKADEAETGNQEEQHAGETHEGSDEKYDYTASLMESSIYHDREIVVSPEIIEQLTSGVVEQFVPSLKKTQSTIAQIKDSQLVLLETVEQENSKFNDCQAVTRLESTMAKAKIYHSKLLKLKKEMTALHEKSAKLKRRAVKLQQQRQKEEMNKAQLKEREYEREKLLTARVAGAPDM